jgi:two-component system, cell cycle response regulator DivK
LSLAGTCFNDSVKKMLSKEEISTILDKRRILIAEDEYLNYMYLEKILKGNNVSLVWAKNGKEAVDFFKNDKSIDVILMDINMPGVNGIEAFHEIRMVDPGIPVIAQTAYAMQEDKELYLDTGFNDYISKPIQREELVIKIKYLLKI